MLKEFNFIKKGYEFSFRNPYFKENLLKFQYKIKNIKENKENDGFFYNSEFDEKNRAIRFYGVNIDGKKIGGVKIAENLFNELKIMQDKFIIEQKMLIDELVNEVVEGKRLIDFNIVGCEYPHYQAWLNNLHGDLSAQNIMEKAIKAIGEKGYINNSCEYLEKKLKHTIATKEEIENDDINAINLKYNIDTQKYHDFKKEVVTSFQIRLSDLINVKKLEEERIRNEKELIEIEERKAEMKVTIIKKGKIKTDLFAEILIEDTKTLEKAEYCCRNIFDVGYVVNPNYEIEGKLGGLERKGYWETFDSQKGWYRIRELTDFEKKAIKYLHEFSPIDTKIRL